MQNLEKFKCTATKSEDFNSQKQLMDLLKLNAQLAIVSCLNKFMAEEYNNFSVWEKFNKIFQNDLIQMATVHSYYMTAFYFLKYINNIDISVDKASV